MTDLWTLTELAARAAVALGDTAGQASARVREVPDARTIRWYQTTGLVDRPLALRGRTALYGRRQLLQLVAIKRLQAQGRSLAEIQAELAGLSTEALEAIADIPPLPPSTSRIDVVRDDRAMIRTRFWTEHNHGSGLPTDDPAADRDPDVDVPASPSEAAVGESPTGRTRPAPGAPAASGGPASADDPAALGESPTDRTAPDAPRRAARAGAASAPARARAAGAPAASGGAAGAGESAADAQPVQGLRLADDVLLILDRPAGVIEPADIEALREAAAPLLDALVRRGLVAKHTRTKEPA